MRNNNIQNLDKTERFTMLMISCLHFRIHRTSVELHQASSTLQTRGLPPNPPRAKKQKQTWSSLEARWERVWMWVWWSVSCSAHQNENTNKKQQQHKAKTTHASSCAAWWMRRRTSHAPLAMVGLQEMSVTACTLCLSVLLLGSYCLWLRAVRWSWRRECPFVSGLV